MSQSEYAVCNNAKLQRKMTAKKLRTQYHDKTFTSGCCALFYRIKLVSLLTVIAVLFCFHASEQVTLENTSHYFLRFFSDISFVCTLTLKTLAPPGTAVITKFQM
jgi:hypothetical protein